MAIDYAQAITEVLDEFRDVYGVNVGQSVLEAFTEALRGCTPKEITRAAVEHMKTSRFAPRPAELRALIQNARAVQTKAHRNKTFWDDCREAERKKHKGGFRVPEGKKVLEYIDELVAGGMTKQQAIDEVCS